MSGSANYKKLNKIQVQYNIHDTLLDVFLPQNTLEYIWIVSSA